jgi:N-carbamoyl-L-amino-acid hydrolase
MQENELVRNRALAERVLAHVDAERLRTAIAELAHFGGRDDGGVARETLTPIDLKARRHLIERARSLGCGVEVDDCANLFFRYPGRTNLPPVLTGSHVDTQPVGGQLDGAYGVVAGLEVLHALRDAAVQTECSIEVVVWTNEEGSRFGPGCMGSSSYVDPPRLAAYRAVKDSNQITFGEALDLALLAVPDVPRRVKQQPLLGFVELHIEQGPVLEKAGVPLGVVHGIQSVRWYRVNVTGVAAHAGTTPMDVRSDAMAASIEIAHRLYAEAAKQYSSGLRLTLGRWVVKPNSINTIPGGVEFSIDMRCADEGVLVEFEALMRETLRSNAGRTKVAVESIFERKPTHFAPEMTALIEESCARTCHLQEKLSPLTLTSGAFHDAMYLADYCPTGMIFVPSIAGISHNAAEMTAHNDLVMGTQALAYALTRIAGV